MTFTIIGRCEKSNLLGIALSSSPLSVAARCPFIKANVGAVSTQAYTDPGLGPLAVNLLELGHSPEKVIQELRESDRLIDWRQIGIVDKHGRSAAHTGKNNADFCGHITEPGFVAMGNGLGGPDVYSRMAKAYKDSAEEILEERLMLALEAGRDAGGDLVGHLSAGLVVYGKDSYARTDLRVDMHLPVEGGAKDAVDDLRRIFNAYKPMIGYYEFRPHNVDKVKEWIDWLMINEPAHLTALTPHLPERARAYISADSNQRVAEEV